MSRTDDEGPRCHQCRYWFERCCHALAQRDGDNRTPARCHHFATEALRLFTTAYESRPC